MNRLGQAIAEGDGISVIAHVATIDDARAAAAQGAEALAVSRSIPGLREATELPILWQGDPDWDAARSSGADAYVVFEGVPDASDVEVVVYVADDEQLTEALERSDPEIFMLGIPRTRAEDPDAAFARVLELLHDVPAGKLAIAELRDASADEVAELERAGVDAVLVASANVAALVPAEPPEV